MVSAYTVDDGGRGNNYTVALHTATGTITPADLDVTAVTDSKTYDGTTSSDETPTVSGLQPGDSVTGWAQAFQSKNVLGAGLSTLAVTAYVVNDGNSGNNYAVTTHTAAGTITPAALDINAVTDTEGLRRHDQLGRHPTASGLQGDRHGHRQGPGLRSRRTSSVPRLSILQVSAYTVNDGNSGNNYAVTHPYRSRHDHAGRPRPSTAVTDTKVYDGTTELRRAPRRSIGLKPGDSVTGAARPSSQERPRCQRQHPRGHRLHRQRRQQRRQLRGHDQHVDRHDHAGRARHQRRHRHQGYDGTTSSERDPDRQRPAARDSVTGLSQAFALEERPRRRQRVRSSVSAGYTVNDDNGGGNYTVMTHTAERHDHPGRSRHHGRLRHQGLRRHH